VWKAALWGRLIKRPYAYSAYLEGRSIERPYAGIGEGIFFAVLYKNV
jgi:hypothetical protein